MRVLPLHRRQRVIEPWVRITDRGLRRVAVLNPTNNDLYIATDANPGSILRVISR